MRLVDWAKKQGISYQTAWRWHKEGLLPVKSIVTPSGMILVDPEEASDAQKKADALREEQK